MIDILAVLTRPDFASGRGPIGDHLNLRGLAARRPDLTIRMIELNAHPTDVDIDLDGMTITQQGREPVRIGKAAVVLYMPVSFDVEETDLGITTEDAPYPLFAHWQWRVITDYFEERLMDAGRCVNAPLAARRANNKLLQWKALKEAGLEVPELTVANRWPRGALAASPSLIRKNLSESGWKAAGVFSPAERVSSSHPSDGLPAIWQRPVETDEEIRCYVMGDEAIFVALARDAEVIDVRQTNDGRPHARFVEPAPGWAETMLRATRILGLDYAVIDALPQGDKLAILEVNSNGVWWFLPAEIGRALEARFHSWLETLVAAARAA
jgi:hypothetical protein